MGMQSYADTAVADTCGVATGHTISCKLRRSPFVAYVIFGDHSVRDMVIKSCTIFTGGLRCDFRAVIEVIA